MKDSEALAEETCEELSAEQLRAICRFRGFNPPAGPKATLAAFVAPRLLEPSGVAEAIASLEPVWLLALHRIAMAGDEPAGLEDLCAIVLPGRPSYSTDWRSFFRRVADGLLNRGVVLIEERLTMFRAASRFACLGLRVPDVHRASLPPFPVPTEPLGEKVRARDALAFCKSALGAAVVQAGGRETAAPDGLLGRVAAAISFAEGRLHIRQATASDPASFLGQVRRLWARGGASRGRPGRTEGALQDATYVVSHLPPGEGVTAKELHAALARCGDDVKPDLLGAWCEEGCEAGLLVSDAREGPARYAAPAEPARSDAAGSDGPLVFRPDERGIIVDIERSALGALLELTELSRVEARDGQLHVLPDIVLLGRQARRLGSLPALEQASSSSPAFRAAVEHVAARHGKLLLHEGLLVLRVEDLGFRTLLGHRLPATRSLGGPYLALPRGLRDEVERIARKEGFAPRRVS